MLLAFNQFATNVEEMAKPVFPDLAFASLRMQGARARDEIQADPSSLVSWQAYVDYVFFTGCQFGAEHVVRLSLRKDLGLPSCAHPFSDQQKPFLFACKGGHLSLAKWLVSDDFKQENGVKFSVHAQDDLALVYAGYNGHVDTVQWLLEEGVSPTARHHQLLRYALEFYQSPKESEVQRDQWTQILHLLLAHYTAPQLCDALLVCRQSQSAVFNKAEQAMIDLLPTHVLHEVLESYIPSAQSIPAMHALKQRKTLLDDVGNVDRISKTPKM